MNGKWGITADGTWRLVSGLPNPRLCGGVSSYQAYELELDRPQRRIEIPNGMVSLVINFDGAIRLASTAPRAPSGLPQAWTSHTSLAAGLRTDATLGEHDGRIRGVEVLLAPWMAYIIFGVDMHELAGFRLSVGDLLGAPGHRLEQQLADALDWPARFAILDALLLQRCARGHTPAPQVMWAWKQLVGSGGMVSIEHLADRTGWSARHLGLRFREQIGLPPKRAARVLRLQRTLRLMMSGHTGSQAAAACGFYDQAHLNREFKAMTGCTPRAFLTLRAVTHRPVDRIPGQVTSALL